MELIAKERGEDEEAGAEAGVAACADARERKSRGLGGGACPTFRERHVKAYF